jgi:hypothetical protein
MSGDRKPRAPKSAAPEPEMVALHPCGICRETLGRTFRMAPSEAEPSPRWHCRCDCGAEAMADTPAEAEAILARDLESWPGDGPIGARILPKGITPPGADDWPDEVVDATVAPQVVLWPIDRLIPDERNARTHSDAQVAQIEASLTEFGWTMPILAASDTNVVDAGHGRLMGAKAIYAKGGRIKLPSGGLLPAGMVPVIDSVGWSEPQRRAYRLADNAIALNAGWDLELVAAELLELHDDINLDILGLTKAAFDLDDPAAPGGQGTAGNMAAEFLIAPFSVLNAREGWWQTRKKQWLALGIRSELGRGSNVLDMSASMAGITDPAEIEAWNQARRKVVKNESPGGGGTGAWIGGPDRPKASDPALKAGRAIPGKGASASASAALPMDRAKNAGLGGLVMDSLSSHPRYYEQKNAAQARLGRELTNEEFEREHWVMPDSEIASGTSIFDPVLCELAYRWFAPQGGVVLDPFAGGSVRGIVAGKLGRRYVGMDLRVEQVAANRAQGKTILTAEGEPQPEWHVGDSLIDLAELDVAADFLFSCPPYGDLEVYSDDPLDLSTMSASAFLDAYRRIIAAAAGKLKMDRFAAFVVGDYRDKRGLYANFVGQTVEAFRSAGLALYNEAILVTSVGSLPIRAAKQFRSTRKLGKTHQNILVFVKGDPRKATEQCGPVNTDAALAEFYEHANADPLGSLGGEV